MMALTARQQLNNLADAMVEDILNAPDGEILEEFLEDGGDIDRLVSDMRAIFEKAKYMADHKVPSVGRMVHFVTSDGSHAPANVCRVNEDGTLNLFVMDDRQQRVVFEFNVVQTSDGSQVFSWHWPEYVPAKEATP